jgi:hypothetical protein
MEFSWTLGFKAMMATPGFRREEDRAGSALDLAGK